MTSEIHCILHDVPVWITEYKAYILVQYTSQNENLHKYSVSGFILRLCSVNEVQSNEEMGNTFLGCV